ncbi:hypothetical protein L226DRAFT_520379 [Lentinus tigrinus ALCF2SS1-7]|uniref:uncharacterized protein n=1 Tax=Lentinus tigrinus ALCF2SS1-7 TaxID=1328758 RepID=UPI001166277A|nr:hypothetical protein L226DRAFT_520379 [Lentinus tigrinus ALCF2SS1-7]
MPILGASAVFAAVTNATAAAFNATAVAGKATSGGADGAKAKPAGISNSDLVFDIDLVLRVWWINGHFLRSVYLEGPAPPAKVLRRPSEKRPNVISPVSPVYLAPSSNTADGSSYEHHQYYTEEWGGMTDISHTCQNAPTHMPGVSTMFPATAAFLRKTIHPGLTIGKNIILVCYSAIMVFAGLYMSNPLSEPVRVIVILGTENNLVVNVHAIRYWTDGFRDSLFVEHQRHVLKVDHDPEVHIGSGITFALAAVQDVMKKDLEYPLCVRAMELVWCIQDPSALTPLIPLFYTFVAQSQEVYASLRISVYYTSALPNPEVLKAFSHLPPGLTLSPVRPKLGKILKGIVNRASALFSGGKERSRGHGHLRSR